MTVGLSVMMGLGRRSDRARWEKSEARVKIECGQHYPCSFATIKTNCVYTGADFCFPIYWKPSRLRRFWWEILWGAMRRLGLEVSPFDSSLKPINLGPWKILPLKWRRKEDKQCGT